MSSIPALVDTDWLAEHSEDPRLTIVDASTFLNRPTGDGARAAESGRAVYEQAHIPGAIFADLLLEFADQDSGRLFTVLPSEVFAQKAGALGIGDGTHVVVYDQGEDMWATRLWWNLRLEGFDAVSILDGGFAAWQDAGLPVAAGTEEKPASTFTPERRPELLADQAAVLAALEDDDVRLINALDPDIFDGTKLTYARPGHIPGSANVFWRDLKSGDRAGTLDAARTTLTRVGALDDECDVITYCGGGIAATYVAFHLAQLGRDDVAVYDGSMTEWAADDSLPLDVVRS
ncbi:MAG: sulfurtransferase [Brevibacterium yomogidense]